MNHPRETAARAVAPMSHWPTWAQWPDEGVGCSAAASLQRSVPRQTCFILQPPCHPFGHLCVAHSYNLSIKWRRESSRDMAEGLWLTKEIKFNASLVWVPALIGLFGFFVFVLQN